LHLMFMKR